ncbi:hypothetical protein [Halospeciosus flavus]|uniref:hypothetical protein n=1 Tax=Halospeciosus flavus TaxID=3032283 RepID=UPI0036175336
MAWEVTRTVRVRLDVPDDRKSDLHATNDLFQHCANRTSEWAWRYPDEECVTSKSDAEDALYEDLREETNGLHANLVQKAIKRAIKDIDNCVDDLADGENTSQPEYDTFSIVYDKRAATYYRDKVSLATVSGRVECDYDSPRILKARRTATTSSTRTTRSARAPSTTIVRSTSSTCTQSWNRNST